jgi:hypothetical protein
VSKVNQYWRKSALCLIDKNSKRWFSYNLEDVDYAKKVCQSCLVRKECIVNMWETDSFYGVNGGMSEFDIMNLTWKAVSKENDSNWKRTDRVLKKLLQQVS